MYPRYVRVRQGRVLAGVCTGLAAHLGIDVRWVRCIFAVLAAIPLVGLLAYGALATLTDAVDNPAQALNPVSAKRFSSRDQAARKGFEGLSEDPDLVDWVLLLIAVGLTLAANIASSKFVPATIGISIAVMGALLVWRNSKAPTNLRSQHPVSEGKPGGTPAARHQTRGMVVRWASAVGGVVLLAIGAGVAVYLLNSNVADGSAAGQITEDGKSAHLTIGALGWSMVAGGAVLIGLLVVCIPLWLRLWNTAAAAAEERARERERAIIASRIHDSVLQTLALIQKQSADQKITSLARSQERQLRQWLFGTEESVKTQTVFGAMRVASGEVEDMYGVRIQPVFVGADRPATNATQEVVFAAREAMVNAAKHSGCTEVNAFVESSSDLLEIFVRDRGKGFDPASIPIDRHGIRDSIVARMQRVGGEVDIDSGSFGTELSFRLPLSHPAREETQMASEFPEQPSPRYLQGDLQGEEAIDD
ncbi:ATP-binding protein [Corynebacterium auriscanis]|uniref:ATP-binding protein n=1 Tax=Corynebacterium auriscanis TaxID=99807 RepID=UPI000689C619|nr:ATP-binding protein [Corynebacterium auriscanis]WJY72440.1 nitrate/nitrite sensor protein NarQ [Corynebacterium auriscanis]